MSRARRAPTAHRLRRPGAGGTVLAAALAVACGGEEPRDRSATGATEALTAAHALVPAPTGGVAALYLTIANQGRGDDTLVAVEVPGAARAELHRTRIVDGLSRMQPVPGIPVPAGATARLEPGGHHAMLFGLEPTPLAGDTLDAVLVFRSGRRVPVRAAVIPYAELEARLGAVPGRPEHGGH